MEIVFCIFTPCANMTPDAKKNVLPEYTIAANSAPLHNMTEVPYICTGTYFSSLVNNG
jgi:hypothetical protein